MKSILCLLAVLFCFLSSPGQTAMEKFQTNIKSLDDWRGRQKEAVTAAFLEDLPPLKKGQVYRACDGWFNQRCIAHHLVCDCPECRKRMAARNDDIDRQYESRYSQYSNQFEIDRKNEEEATKRKEAEEEKIAKKKEAEEEEKAKEEKARNEREAAKKKDSSERGKNERDSSYTATDPHITEMTMRSNQQMALDQSEDKSMGAIATTTATLMAGAMMKNLNNKDDDNELETYLKLTLGLGMQDIPVTNNKTYKFDNYSTGGTTVTNTSESSTTGHYSVNVGLLFATFNDKFVSLRIAPFLTYGMNAFSAGTSGDHFSYGSAASLGFGHRVKFLLKGEYARRSGNQVEDDAVFGIDGTGTANYNYSTLKYGAGLFVGFKGHDNFGELSMYRENVSFLKGIKAEVYSYELKISYSIFAFGIQYAPNYPIAGDVTFKDNYQKDKQNLLLASIYVPFKIFGD